MACIAEIKEPKVSSKTDEVQGDGSASGGKRKKRKHNPDAELHRTLDFHSKHGDVVGALDFYDKHSAAGTFKFQQYHFNILLYLCGSAASGSVQVGGKVGGSEKEEGGAGKANGEATPGTVRAVSREVQTVAAKRGIELLGAMRERGVPLNEAALTAAARLAAAQGDGVRALACVQEMRALGIPPRLRSYGPALFTFCQLGPVESALAVDRDMQAAGVSPGEEELAALLGACSRAGRAEEVYELVHRLRSSVREVSAATMATIRFWFQSDAAAAAGSTGCGAPATKAVEEAMEARGGGWHGLGWLGGGPWKVQEAAVGEDSRCSACAGRLETIDLDPAERDAFARSLAAIACERESRPNDFRQFQDWLERHGPFDAVVDAANIGLCNQNFSGGGFNFWQLEGVVREVQRLSPQGRPPLVILHNRRTKGGPAAAPFAQKVLGRYREEGAFYATPTGSNDDWYWLYAAVQSGALLVSNDEMRDHVFQLLGNDFFPKWKERHQVRYSFARDIPQLHLPPPYSRVIQEAASGAWHFPRAAGDDVSAPREWLCVGRQAHDSSKGRFVGGEGRAPAEEEVVLDYQI